MRSRSSYHTASSSFTSGGAAFTGISCREPQGLHVYFAEKLDDGWPESVEERGLLLLVWRRNFRNDI